MSRTVSIDEMADAINEGLKEYATLAIVDQLNFLRNNINGRHLMMLAQQSCNRQSNITP